MDDSEHIRLYENTINEIIRLKKQGYKSFCLMCNEGFLLLVKKKCKFCKNGNVVPIFQAKQLYLQKLEGIFKKRNRKPYGYRIVDSNGKYILIGKIEPQWIPEKPCENCGQALIETFQGDKCCNKDCLYCRENENYGEY